MVYLTGDTHGPTPLGLHSVDGFSKRFNRENFPEQKEMGRDDFVIICGDFGGVWNYDSRYDESKSAFKEVVCLEHGESKEERYWLNWLDEKPFTTLFCDGNHENFDRLDHAYPEVDFHGGRAHKIRENVYHLMRGYVFDLNGKTFFVFGGASSHDIRDGVLHPANFGNNTLFLEEYGKWNRAGRQFRVDHFSWWERELPTQEEMDRGMRNLEACGNKVDFVITHCAPHQVAAAMGYTDRDRLGSYLNMVAETTKFTKWFFGHYHDNRSIFVKFLMLYEQVIRIV